MIRSRHSWISRFGMLLLGIATFATSAGANIVATPSFHDFGYVERGGTRMTTITFQNFSSTPVPYFAVHCSGDFSVFQCFSMCSSLPAYGSCSVQIQFHARNGDGMRKSFWLNGSGGHGSASATVYGTDARSGD